MKKKVLFSIKLRIKTFVSESYYNLFFLISLIFFNILYLVFAFYFHDIFQETDGYSYYEYYQDIISNRNPPEYSEFWPLGLPCLIGFLSIFIGDFFISGKIIIVEFSIMFLISIYLTIKKVFNERIGFITYFLIATSHHMILLYFNIFSDIPFASLIMFSIYFLLEDTEEHKKNLIYSSLFAGLATLIRWTGIFFLFFIILKSILDIIKASNRDMKVIINKLRYNTLIGISVFFIIMLPYLILNTLWWGSPFYNQNIYNVYKAMRLYAGDDWEEIEGPHRLSWSWILF
ncbi:MAG: ArnT family glycosyltransferase, partial [Candidatus Hodarchaeota archaeon]